MAQVWDWRDGEVHLVGQASVPFETLITPGFEAPLINPKKKNVRLLLSPTCVRLGEAPHRLANSLHWWPWRRRQSFSLRGKYKDSGKVQLMSVTEERDLRWSGEPPRGYEMVIRGDKLDAKDMSKVSSSHSFLLFKTAQVHVAPLSPDPPPVLAQSLTFTGRGVQGVVHRTEVVKGTVQPRWKPILLELDHVRLLTPVRERTGEANVAGFLGGGARYTQVGALGKYYYGWRRQQILHPSREVEQQQPWLDEYIVIECWNWQANGRHELIGVSPVLCMRDFLTCTRYQFTLINKEKKERCVPAPTCVCVAVYVFAHIHAEGDLAAIINQGGSCAERLCKGVHGHERARTLPPLGYPLCGGH